jgi:lipoyl(octanoyl) transferase
VGEFEIINKIDFIDLKIMDYYDALKIQEEMFQKRIENKIKNTVLFVEHPPVITLGRRGKSYNILLNKKELNEKNIKVYDVNRGGDVTYHGPGQIVGYFIFDLNHYEKDIKKFIYNLEEVFINLLKNKFNIDAYREDGKYTGIWVNNKKITAIGIFIKKYVTMHGCAFNVNTDLSHFNWIIPCGINRKATSLSNILGQEFTMDYIKNILKDEINKVFC